MKDAISVLKSRRSCRKFDGRKVPEKELSEILEAGMYAPSGMGRQSAIMVVLDDEETISELSKMNAAIMGTLGDPFYGAKTVIVVLANKDVPTYLYDGSLVMGNLMNAAEALGIESCWIHRAKEEFESQKGKVLLKKWGIEGNYEGIGHCVLGYGEKAPEKPRKENYIYRIK